MKIPITTPENTEDEMSLICFITIQGIAFGLTYDGDIVDPVYTVTCLSTGLMVGDPSTSSEGAIESAEVLLFTVGVDAYKEKVASRGAITLPPLVEEKLGNYKTFVAPYQNAET